MVPSRPQFAARALRVNPLQLLIVARESKSNEIDSFSVLVRERDATLFATIERIQKRGEQRCGGISTLAWAAKLRVRRRCGARCLPGSRRPRLHFWPLWPRARRPARNPWAASAGPDSIPAAMAAARTRTAEMARPAPPSARKACRLAAPASLAQQAWAQCLRTHRAAAAAAAPSETRRPRAARAA